MRSDNQFLVNFPIPSVWSFREQPFVQHVIVRKPQNELLWGGAAFNGSSLNLLLFPRHFGLLLLYVHTISDIANPASFAIPQRLLYRIWKSSPKTPAKSSLELCAANPDFGIGDWLCFGSGLGELQRR